MRALTAPVRRVPRRLAALWPACAAAILGGCAADRAPLEPVAHVDLPRYMGDWYVIGEIPNLAERHCVGSIESYALRPDGDIDNTFACRSKSLDAPLERRFAARAHVIDTRSNAEWRLHFFRIIPASYLVLDLDPDYQWVMVGHPSRHYGWIMARSPSLAEPTYAAVLERTRRQGYDPSRFERVPQQAPGAGGRP